MNRFLRIFFAMIVIVLAFLLFKKPLPVSQASSDNEIVSYNQDIFIDPPKSDEKFVCGEISKFYYPKDIKGKLCFVNDDIFWENHYRKGWRSHLLIKNFSDNPNAPEMADKLINRITKIEGDLFEDPVFSHDGKKIFFKYGDNSSEMNTYPFGLYLYDTTDKAIKKIISNNSGISSSFPELWSPDDHYIAYFKFGLPSYQIAGSVHIDDYPLELWVYDVKNQKNILIKKDGLIDAIGWTTNNKLLFSVHAKKIGVNKSISPLYLYDFSAVKPSKIISPDAISPIISPDGKWVAAFSKSSDGLNFKGLTHQSLLKAKVDKTSILKLFSMDGGKPIVIDKKINDARLRWSPDSKYLYFITHIPKGKAKITNKLLKYSIGAKSIINVFTFDIPVFDLMKNNPYPFQLLSVTNDGKYLLFANHYEVEKKYHGFPYYNLRSFNAVSLDTGNVVNLANIEGYSKIDWHDESVKKK